MKKTALVILLLSGLAAWASAGEIAFVGSYDEALKQASEKSQNMVITFYADW